MYPVIFGLVLPSSKRKIVFVISVAGGQK